MAGVRADDAVNIPTSIWRAIRASALRRLGKPVLLGYVAVLALGSFIVVVSIAAMFFGWRFG